MKEKVLVDRLKGLLRSKGINYQQIADALEVSLPTVRRDFSKANFTIKRLLRICEIFKIPPSLLFSMEEEVNRKSLQLSLEQEKFFSKNIKYWGFLDLLLGGNTPNELSEKYNLSNDELIKYLKKLDKFKLIKWLPGNEVKVLYDSVEWRKDGPLREAFLKINESLFLNSNFEAKEEFYSFFVDEIPKRSIDKIISEFKKVEDLIENEAQICKFGRRKTKTIGVMMGVRPWNFNPFEED